MPTTMFLTMALCFALSISVAVSIGLASLIGAWQAKLNLLAIVKEMFGAINKFPLAAIPFFILAGNLMESGGISARLVDFAKSLVGGLQGGLAATCVLTCMIFAAVSGSSVATTFAIGAILIPALIKHGYPTNFAAALQATSAELGVIIPPSIPMILYGVSAEVSIGELFISGFGPGLLIGIVLMVFVVIYARFKGYGKGDREGKLPVLVATRRAALALFMPVLILGGIYGGVFTPTEAAAIGTVGALCFAVWLGGMRWQGLVECLYGTAEATGMIFLILLGADVLNVFLALTQMPTELAKWVGGLGLSPLLVLFLIIGIYVVLGCVMDSLSMILLTVPIFLPVVMGFDYFGLDPTEKAIWFGILALMVVEIGLITPPVGMNVYIINSLAKDVPMSETFRGVVPFLVSDALRVVLLVFFPGLSLWLVRLLAP
jgi:tripartite ATP-independent transporter DctM subunit